MCCRFTRLALPVFLAILLIGCTSIPYPEANWIEVRTAGFTVISNADEGRTLAIARAFERFRGLVAPLTGATRISPVLPTRIFVFGDLNSAKHYDLGKQVNGYALPRTDAYFISIYAPGRLSRSPLRTVFHEYTHFLMHNQERAPHYPLWYSEGLAGALSTVEFEQDHITVGRIPGKMLRSLKYDPSLPMKLVVTTNGYFKDPLANSAFYAQSWIFVHRLTWGQTIGFEDRYEQMLRYLARTSRGDDTAQVFQEEFGVTFHEMGNELDRYRRRRPPTIRVDAQELTYDFEPTVRILPVNERLHQLARLQVAIGTAAGAKEGENLARRALELTPADPVAEVLLARSLAVQEKQVDYEALERALNQAPNDPEIVLGVAELYLEQLQRTSVALPDSENLARQAKELFERGTSLAPELPSGYFGLGKLFLLENDLMNAATAFEHALQLARYNLEIAFSLGQVYADLGLNEQALVLLREVVGASHDKIVRDQAKALLDQLEQKSRDAG